MRYVCIKSVNMLSFVYICIQNNISDKPYGDSLSFMTDTVFPGAIKITINSFFCKNERKKRKR